MQIDGARFLVTGASSGIGAALAPQLAAKGATVGVVARRAERLEQVVEQCRAHTPGSTSWAADLGDVERAQQVVLEAWDAFGGLDCLVNNAAIPKRTPVPRLDLDQVDTVMQVNFRSPVAMTLAVLPRMLDRGRGLVVNVSSIGGRIGIAHEAAYCASKFALCGWSEVMRIDLDGTGVDVKLVLPGPIATEIWDQPGNDPALYDGPFVPADECAASIVAAIEDDGFEYFAPPEFPGGLAQRDIVIGKTNDPDGFLAGMAAMERASREASGSGA